MDLCESETNLVCIVSGQQMLHNEAVISKQTKKRLESGRKGVADQIAVFLEMSFGLI